MQEIPPTHPTCPPLKPPQLPGTTLDGLDIAISTWTYHVQKWCGSTHTHTHTHTCTYIF